MQTKPSQAKLALSLAQLSLSLLYFFDNIHKFWNSKIIKNPKNLETSKNVLSSITKEVVLL